MEFDQSLKIAASGLKAQSGRMRIIAENIANADSTARTADGDPYRRKVPTFASKFDKELGASTVELGRVERDRTDFKSRYEPGHPAADATGYVKYPNVEPLIESVDMREAQRSYEANLNIVTATRRMILKTLDILKV
ncbi:MAG: flagellar basal body rod protein FlgC [Siculibacillus sp.]|nr:flagellar basal body rod protein FlgC [Siculibacillus sp.]